MFCRVSVGESDDCNLKTFLSKRNMLRMDADAKNLLYSKDADDLNPIPSCFLFSCILMNYKCRSFQRKGRVLLEFVAFRQTLSRFNALRTTSLEQSRPCSSTSADILGTLYVRLRLYQLLLFEYNFYGNEVWKDAFIRMRCFSFPYLFG